MRPSNRQQRSHLCQTALLAAACALASCAHGTAHSQTEAPAEAHEGGGLQLNAGQKWKANAETTEGAHALASIVQQAAARTDASAEDRQATVGQLRETFQNIFRQCTMTGPAHEQLHHFLVPVGELLSALEASEGEAFSSTLQYLQAHLGQYDQFFE